MNSIRHMQAKPSNRQETFLLQNPQSHFHQLSQAKAVTIVDLSKNYYCIELDEATSFFATFNTVFRRFSLSVAGDKFQYKLGTIFTTLNFCTGIIGGMKKLIGVTMKTSEKVPPGCETAQSEIKLRQATA